MDSLTPRPAIACILSSNPNLASGLCATEAWAQTLVRCHEQGRKLALAFSSTLLSTLLIFTATPQAFAQGTAPSPATTAPPSAGAPAAEPGATPSTAPKPAKAQAPTNTQAKDKKMSAGNPTVEIETSLGTITVELDQAKAPLSVANFLKYVDDKHYDGVIFHRVIDGFMIQGGGMTADMKEKKTRDPIKNEADNGLKNLRGTLAMARTNVVDSATAQFFINVKDNDFLNHRSKDPQGYGYAVFGKVTGGMDVVDKIKSVRTSNSGFHQNVPVEPVVIKSVRRK
jgi:peptidyl-prolyl cis-trans isomerase B (cyclophilin B)